MTTMTEQERDAIYAHAIRAALMQLDMAILDARQAGLSVKFTMLGAVGYAGFNPRDAVSIERRVQL